MPDRIRVRGPFTHPALTYVTLAGKQKSDETAKPR
jgi:hypothetical protein